MKSKDIEMISVPRELLEQALKADASQGASAMELYQGWLAMKVLRAALTQPAEQHQGEPVAWLYRDPDGNARDQITDNRATEEDRGGWLSGMLC